MIAGASSGIGAAITEALLQDGHKVWMCARRSDRLDALANGRSNASTHRCDVGDEKDVIEFPSPSDALRGYFKNGEAINKWRADGRWDGIRRHFEESGRSFTARAQVMGAARKVSP